MGKVVARRCHWQRLCHIQLANCCQYVCNANKLYLIKGTRVPPTTPGCPMLQLLPLERHLQRHLHLHLHLHLDIFILWAALHWWRPRNAFWCHSTTAAVCCCSYSLFCICQLDIFTGRLPVPVSSVPKCFALPSRPVVYPNPIVSSLAAHQWLSSRSVCVGYGFWDLWVSRVECLLSCLSICRPLFNQYIDTHFISPSHPHSASCPKAAKWRCSPAPPQKPAKC